MHAAGAHEPQRLEIAGVDERDHHDRADVVGDRERQQEEAQSGRDPRPEHRQHGHRERDVGGDGDAPAVGVPGAGVEREEEQGGHDHPADGRDGGQRGGPPVAQARPTTSSRLISRPTTKKKTAISPSLIHWPSDSVREPMLSSVAQNRE